MQENKPFIFQRFTQKRYEDYKKKGIEFYVINAEGHYCEIQAFNCGENKDCAPTMINSLPSQCPAVLGWVRCVE